MYMDGTDPLQGTLFDHRYLINFLVTRGGMGNIYQATDIKTGRVVAIKMLKPDLGADPTILRRFQRESDVVSQLKHPNICQFYESNCTQDGTHYFTMEYLEGHALNEIIAMRRMIEPRVALNYMIQAAQGLCDAHAHGVVHRDLKPANLFVVHEANDQEFIKVLDFGVAKVDDDYLVLHEKLTQYGSTLGTPFYMSPEQIQGSDVDGRSDIFALGVILWECLFGEPVFKGHNMLEIFKATLGGKLPKLPVELRSNLMWQKIYSVLSKALQKDRNRRYGSMHEFLRALESIVSAMDGVKNQSTPKTVSSWRMPKTLFGNWIQKVSLIKLVLVGAISIVCVSSGYIAIKLLHAAPHPVNVSTKYATYKIYSDEPARVWIRGQEQGRTPLSLDLSLAPPFEIEVEGESRRHTFLVEHDWDGILGFAVNLREGVEERPQIHVETTPSGAQVRGALGELCSSTPCVIPAPLHGGSMEVSITREGYETEHLTLVPQGSTMHLRTNLFRVSGR